MAQSLPSWFQKNWERKFLVLIVVLIAGILLTWRFILEAPPAPAPRQISLPAPPHLFQWENDTPDFLMPNNVRDTDNPFVIQFPLEKPTSEPQIPQEEVEVLQEPELPPPEPLKRTVVITFQGIRSAISGKVYAILEIADSEKGVYTAYVKKDAPNSLDCGFKLAEVTDKAIRLIDQNGNDLGEVNYGDTRIFTLDPKE